MKRKVDKNNRRDFIKTSAILTGGALLSGLPLTGAYAAGSDTIKIALIGCGNRGTGAAFQALNTKHNVKVVAMADAFGDKLDKAYKALFTKYGAEKIAVPDNKKFVGFDGYKHAMEDADVVLLATPPGFRPIHFEEAVRQNKQVFMEKPVAVDSPGIRKVLAAAEEAKRKKLNVVVGLQRHYQKSYIETVKRIHNGEIGDVVSGQVYWNSGGVWVNPRQPDQNEMEYQMRNWYYFNWLCGDHIVEQHVHNIDVANWVKNKYPVSAYGAGGRFLRTGKDSGEIFDNHSVEFVYDDGTTLLSQCRHFTGGQNRIDETFQGTKGKAYFGSNSGKLWDHKGNVIFNYDGKGDPNPYQAEHDELFAAVAEKQFKFADAENAAKSTMTAIMGRYATYSGDKVKLDDALNSDINLMPDRFAWDAMPKILPDANGNYPHAIPGVSKVV